MMNAKKKSIPARILDLVNERGELTTREIFSILKLDRNQHNAAGVATSYLASTGQMKRVALGRYASLANNSFKSKILNFVNSTDKELTARDVYGSIKLGPGKLSVTRSVLVALTKSGEIRRGEYYKGRYSRIPKVSSPQVKKASAGINAPRTIKMAARVMNFFTTKNSVSIKPAGLIIALDLKSHGERRNLSRALMYLVENNKLVKITVGNYALPHKHTEESTKKDPRTGIMKPDSMASIVMNLVNSFGGEIKAMDIASKLNMSRLKIDPVLSYLYKKNLISRLGAGSYISTETKDFSSNPSIKTLLQKRAEIDKQIAAVETYNKSEADLFNAKTQNDSDTKKLLDKRKQLVAELDIIGDSIAKATIYQEALMKEEEFKKQLFPEKQVTEEFDEATKHMRQLFKTKLVDEDLSIRALNCLKAADIETVADIVSFNKNDFLHFRNFGKKSLAEITELIQSKGLCFGMNLTRYQLDKD